MMIEPVGESAEEVRRCARARCSVAMTGRGAVCRLYDKVSERGSLGKNVSSWFGSGSGTRIGNRQAVEAGIQEFISERVIECSDRRTVSRYIHEQGAVVRR